MALRDKGPIPEEVKRFILVNVPSVPYLEALLLLRKEAGRQWDGKLLAQRVYISEALAKELLQSLHAADIAKLEDEQNGLYRYAPATDHLVQTVDLLADSYTKNLVEISMLIHSKAGKKAQQFADAFKLRKDA
jgi:hypothetical protein